MFGGADMTLSLNLKQQIKLILLSILLLSMSIGMSDFGCTGDY